MRLCTTLENLDNIPDGETRKIINYTAGDGIDITNGVISATGGGSSSNSTIGTIVASPASGNTNLGSFTAWGWQRVPLTRVIRQVNSSFALEDNFLVNKSNKTINVLVSANGMFEFTSSNSQTTYDMCIDYRTPTTTIGAISEAYVKVQNAFNSVVVSPMLVAVEPGAKLSLSLRFNNNGTAKVNGDNTFITVQELEVPVFFGNDSAIVESGSNANGDYIKYSDGRMICYKTVTGTVQITEQYYGYFYRTPDNKLFNLGDYAMPFISRPICSITFRGGNAQWIAAIQNQSATHAGDLQILSVTSKTAGAYYDVIAIGRWK